MREAKLRGALWAVFMGIVGAMLWSGGVAASPPLQDDPVTRGKYLANIAGCVDCHTPLVPQFDPKNPNDLQKLAFSNREVLDTSARLLGGGQPFDLGPGGVIFSRNLTPDKESGLGDWTDDEIKTAIRTGQSRKGNVLHPLMPYHVFNSMADGDVSAIVAYLRSVPPVKNSVPPNSQVPGLKPLPVRNGITAPSPSDTNARGAYLMYGVLACTDCHTPIDAASGAPVMSKYLGGGQPYEGPWGIVYGGNITPHDKTGIGSWSDADIRRILSSGVRPDGRRSVLMPWQTYANLTEQDAQAVVAYLRKGVVAVDNQVPATSLRPEFTKFVELPAAQQQPSNTVLYTSFGVAVVLLVVGGGVVLWRRRNSKR